MSSSPIFHSLQLSTSQLGKTIQKRIQNSTTIPWRAASQIITFQVITLTSFVQTSTTRTDVLKMLTSKMPWRRLCRDMNKTSSLKRSSNKGSATSSNRLKTLTWSISQIKGRRRSLQLRKIMFSSKFKSMKPKPERPMRPKRWRSSRKRTLALKKTNSPMSSLSWMLKRKSSRWWTTFRDKSQKTTTRRMRLRSLRGEKSFRRSSKPPRSWWERAMKPRWRKKGVKKSSGGRGFSKWTLKSKKNNSMMNCCASHTQECPTSRRSKCLWRRCFID